VWKAGIMGGGGVVISRQAVGEESVFIVFLTWPYVWILIQIILTKQKNLPLGQFIVKVLLLSLFFFVDTHRTTKRWTWEENNTSGYWCWRWLWSWFWQEKFWVWGIVFHCCVTRFCQNTLARYTPSRSSKFWVILCICL